MTFLDRVVVIRLTVRSVSINICFKFVVRIAKNLKSLCITTSIWMKFGCGSIINLLTHLFLLVSGHGTGFDV